VDGREGRRGHILIRLSVAPSNIEQPVNLLFVEMADHPGDEKKARDHLSKSIQNDFNHVFDAIISHFSKWYGPHICCITHCCSKEHISDKKGRASICSELITQYFTKNSFLLMLCCVSPNLDDYDLNQKPLKVFANLTFTS
jgi:hypothetical protein